MGSTKPKDLECPCLLCVHGGEGCLFGTTRSKPREVMCDLYGVRKVPISATSCRGFVRVQTLNLPASVAA